MAAPSAQEGKLDLHAGEVDPSFHFASAFPFALAVSVYRKLVKQLMSHGV